MTVKQLKRILGTNSINGVQIPKLTTIYMSQNFYVVPERDIFTLDETNELLIVEQRHKKGEGTEDILAFCFDINNIVGLEWLSVKSRY